MKANNIINWSIWVVMVVGAFLYTNAFITDPVKERAWYVGFLFLYGAVIALFVHNMKLWKK
jgi:hypothetical protein